MTVMNTFAAESLAQIEACGVVRAGGAGFPTHVKLTAAADTILLNAAECEPLLHKDKELLRVFPDEVIAGLEIARRLVGASRAIIGIKYKYTDVIALLQDKLPAGMSITELSDSYPAGDEFILVYDTTKKDHSTGKNPACRRLRRHQRRDRAQHRPRPAGHHQIPDGGRRRKPSGDAGGADRHHLRRGHQAGRRR